MDKGECGGVFQGMGDQVEILAVLIDAAVLLAKQTIGWMSAWACERFDVIMRPLGGEN